MIYPGAPLETDANFNIDYGVPVMDQLHTERQFLDKEKLFQVEKMHPTTI